MKSGHQVSIPSFIYDNLLFGIIYFRLGKNAHRQIILSQFSYVYKMFYTFSALQASTNAAKIFRCRASFLYMCSGCHWVARKKG